MELKEIGGKIRQRRKELGISQQELADAVGYSDRGLISRVEAGTVNITMDKMIRIADKLRVPVSAFFETYDTTPDVFVGLSDSGKKRALEYIEMIRKAELWQKQNGTARDGASVSLEMGRPGASRALPLEEEVKPRSLKKRGSSRS